jgi:hypothetical protein
MKLANKEADKPDSINECLKVGKCVMRMIVRGFAGAALGAVFATGLGTYAQPAAPANYSRAFTEVAVANDFIEKAVTAVGVDRRSARRTARRRGY